MLNKSDKGLDGEFSISPSEINLLPRLAQIAFGARCVYRLLPLAPIGSRVHDYCTQILDPVEQLTGHKIIGTEGYSQLDRPLRHAYGKLGFKILPGADEIIDRPRQAALRVCEAAIDDLWDQYLTKDGAGKIWSASVEAWHAYHDCDTGNQEANNRVAVHDIEMVDGRVAGLEGVMWATEEFNYSQLSGEGNNSMAGSAGLLNSSDYPGELVIIAEHSGGITDVPRECDCGVWGDVTGEGDINPQDVTYIVQFVYFTNDIREQPPNCPLEAGDVAGCDGNVNPQDVTFMVQYVYFTNDMFCADSCGQ